MSKQNRIFALLCLVSAITLAAYILWARTRSADNTSDAPKSMASAVEAAAPSTGSATDSKPPPGAPARRIFFRYSGIDRHYGQLAFAPYESLDQSQFIETLYCEAAYVAGGRGICLAPKNGLLTTYAAKLFDANTFKIIAEFPLKGVPSRCRMSSDGKLAAATVFLSGHDYASVNFSAQTLLIDVDNSRIIADLEEFSIGKDGHSFSNKDFNFWGVTFTPDARHFYATLSTGQQHFLIKGNIAKRSATVIHENVECPSLSPDASRIAYKKRFMVNGRVLWQLHILDLKTNRETPLSERRSVDDQLEWLDNNRVLYSLPKSSSSAITNIWLAAADGSSDPMLFLKNAYSPSAALLQ